jgi:hypothetical protein
MLEMWRHRPPSRFDFLSELESFSYFSYQCILYGMGYTTDLTAARVTYPDMGPATRWFSRIAEMGERGMHELPTHRDLVEQIYRSGYAPGGGGPLSVKMTR